MKTRRAVSVYAANCLNTVGSPGYYSSINRSILPEVSDQPRSALLRLVSGLVPRAPRQPLQSLLLSVLMNFNKLMEIKCCTHLVSVVERRERLLIGPRHLWKRSSVEPEAVFSPFTPFISTLTAELQHVSDRCVIYCYFWHLFSASATQKCHQ